MENAWRLHHVHTKTIARSQWSPHCVHGYAAFRPQASLHVREIALGMEHGPVKVTPAPTTGKVTELSMYVATNVFHRSVLLYPLQTIGLRHTCCVRRGAVLCARSVDKLACISAPDRQRRFVTFAIDSLAGTSPSDSLFINGYPQVRHSCRPWSSLPAHERGAI